MQRFPSDTITILCLLIFSLISTSNFHAQSFSINYTSKDGLENENIVAIAEDLDGYIYVGSASGVMLFDGVSFIPFSKNGTGSLPDNVFVYDLTFDQENNLWLWSELNGIYHWNRIKNHWTNFSITSPPDFQIPTNEIKCISAIDSLLYFSCRRYGLHSVNIYDLSLNLNIDASKNTYSDIDTLDGSLILNGHKDIFEFRNGKLNSISNTNKHSFVDTEIYQGKFYLSKYESGLFKSEKGKLESLNIDEITDPWRTRILGIVDGELFATCKNSGLLKYNIELHSGQVISAQPYDYNSLIKAKYNCGLIDSRGIIWVATTKGISCFNPKLQGFKNINNRVEVTDYLLDVIYHEKSSNYIAVYASSANKVKIFNQDLQLRNSFNHTPETNNVGAIYNPMTHNDDVYALSHKLYKIDPYTGKCTLPKNKYLQSLSQIRTANIDNEGNLWCIHDKDILIVFDLNTQQKIIEKKLPIIDGSSKIKYRFHSINFDNQTAFIAAGSVFFAVSKTGHNVQIFDIEDGGPKLINDHPKRNNDISKVFNFQNHLYICSRGDGIFKTKYDSSNSSFEVLNHLSSHDLYSPNDFGFDDQEDMWVATDNGLALLDDNLGIEKTFNSKNGLSNSKLSNGLSIVNNTIFLSGESGITIGKSNLLKIKYHPKSVDIARFEMNGTDYSNSLEEMNFPYTEKNISIKLSMPIYGINSDYKYHYRLLGSNSNWKSIPVEKNEINYENLNPGNYTFEVKSVVSQNEGEVSKIQFVIRPPFWKTTYFILFAIVLFTLLLFLLYKYRINKNIEKERINTLLSQLENTAIRSQLNPHFIFNSLNSIRSMILLDRKNDSVQYLEQFSDMVREVLQMSKEEKVTLDHEISFNKNYLEIEKLRFANKFKYNFNIEEGLDTNHIVVPPLIIQPFVENAVWHGLLHNDKESILNIDIKSDDGSLHIIIDDNGLGREKSKLLQKSSIKKTKRNLGVSLSKKRISMLGSNANLNIIDKYNDDKPTGTTVHIKIPLKYER